MKINSFLPNNKRYVKVLLFLLLTFFISTLLNQHKYYGQLTKSRELHYQDVMYLLEAMNKECLLKNSESVCFEQFKSVVNNYSNRGTITLYNTSNELLLEKKEEAIYDHRVPVTITHTFKEFPSTAPTLEISKLTSYSNLWVNSLNAMTFSIWTYIEDAFSRLTGNEPVIKNLTWAEFGKYVAWERFYPSLPFVLVLIVFTSIGFWQKMQTERLNRKLIAEHQSLNNDNEQLQKSVKELKFKMESSESERKSLTSQIDNLEYRIKNSVDKNEISLLLNEKSALVSELERNSEEKDLLFIELTTKNQEQAQLKNKIAEYEIKSGFTLVGEFVRQWTFFESQLHRLCSTQLKERMAKKGPAVNSVDLINDLYNQAILNQKLYDEIFKVRKFRNSLMHGSKNDHGDDYRNITRELKDYISILDFTNSKLSAEEYYPS